jgi:hypothetical protein
MKKGFQLITDDIHPGKDELYWFQFDFPLSGT